MPPVALFAVALSLPNLHTPLLPPAPSTPGDRRGCEAARHARVASRCGCPYAAGSQAGLVEHTLERGLTDICCTANRLPPPPPGGVHCPLVMSHDEPGKSEKPTSEISTTRGRGANTTSHETGGARAEGSDECDTGPITICRLQLPPRPWSLHLYSPLSPCGTLRPASPSLPSRFSCLLAGPRSKTRRSDKTRAC